MRTELELFALEQIARPSEETPSEWAVRNVVFHEEEYKGPFQTERAEYLIETLDDFADPTITDRVDCWGSQVFKTAMLMAGVCWRLKHRPGGIFWPFPTRTLAQRFSYDRLKPCLSHTLPELIPYGASRHAFATLNLRVGGSKITLTGSNSAAELASTSAGLVIQDETDKFNMGGKREANASNLADQRTKRVTQPQRRKTSTPTLYSGLIWQAFLRGDQRRYMMTCKLCGNYHPSSRRVLLAWSPNYTVFKKTGNEAYVRWDKEAKRKDGTWDLERVHKSAHFVCPHCSGHIREGHKPWMLKNGLWQATAPAAPSYHSSQLSSLYSCSTETTVGKLAVKFIEAKQSVEGVQGFINGDLAEPWQSQDTLGERVEIITSRLEVTAEWRKLLTVDCQQRSPHFWHIVRAWDGKRSEGIEGGPLDTWEDIEARQSAHNIADICVAVDSGWGAYDEAEVYKNCARRSDVIERDIEGRLPLLAGWIPCKGIPGRRKWKDGESGLFVPYYLRPTDPFSGSSDGGKVEISLLEFSTDYIKDVLDKMRLSKDGWEWKVAQELATETYWQHMDAEVKAAQRSANGFVKWTWAKRSKHWPDHLRDCEVLQVALANFLQICQYE